MEHSTQRRSAKRPGLPFIPAKLDELGLTPHEFRVYCHIARRAGPDGVCFDSIESASRTCRIEKKTYRRALRRLICYGLVLKTTVPGCPHQLRLASVTNWHPSQLTPLPEGSKRAIDSQRPTIQPSPPPSATPPTKDPPKSTEKKVLQHIEDPAEKIWAVYPKKAGKKEGIKAIKKALQSGVPFDYLLKKTKEYATAVQDRAPQYIKNAQGWFNGERYNDDSKAWQSSTNAPQSLPLDYEEGLRSWHTQQSK